MLFYEPVFLFLLLPSVCFALLLVKGARARVGVLLVASLIFYAWSEPRFVAVVLASALLDHLLAHVIARAGGARAGRLALAAGVIANLAILVFYKYTAFAVTNVNLLLASPFAVPHILLPIGVSFIVFEKITYLVDIHRGQSRPAPTVATYLLYVLFFPKLLAGPIIKYHDLEPQLRDTSDRPRGEWLVALEAGFPRFMLGAVKKLLLADPLAAGADQYFAANAGPLGFVDAWTGVLLFTFQIWLDFSAYSDMAIGLARMMGFRLPENFDKPYIARSITEFWRRWHISLSTWIRDYLYIPLGGSRVSPPRRLANLWICFLASGLWHGAAWTYVAWGAYNGLFLVFDRLFLLRWLERLPPALANALTFLIVTVGWTIFRATSLDQAGGFLAAMARPGLAGQPNVYLTPDTKIALAITILMTVAPRLPGYAALRDRLAPIGGPPLNPGMSLSLRCGVALLFVGAVAEAMADPFKPFIYFRF